MLNRSWSLLQERIGWIVIVHEAAIEFAFGTLLLLALTHAAFR